MKNQSKMPHLRLCVTRHCGCKCIYCRPGGESCSQLRSDQLNTQQFVSLVEMLASHGISEVKITGGEPMLRPDILEIIRGIHEIPGIVDVQLITMDPRAGQIAKDLKDSGVSCLNFSIDSLVPEVFRTISGVDCLPDLLEAIEKCHYIGIPLKFNTVVMRDINHSEIPRLIDFAGKYGATLKLLDLMQVTINPEFFNQHYVPFGPIMERLAKNAVSSDFVLASGGLGTPMARYVMPSGATVLVKDASIGTWYGDICNECPNFPCQDAIMALRLTSDGYLQRCMLRQDHLVDMLSAIKDGKSDDAIQTVINTYLGAKYIEGAWHP